MVQTQFRLAASAARAYPVADRRWNGQGDAMNARETPSGQSGTAALMVWLYAGLACLVLVLIAWFFVDRPFAEFSHAQQGWAYRQIFFRMQQLPEIFPALAAIGIAVMGLHGLRRRVLAGLPRLIVILSVSYLSATAMKEQLKYAFGRTWPETWVRDNPSWIRDHVFGFFPFHGGPGWASFPSGHSTAIASVMVVLWIAVPRLRPLWSLAIAAVVIGLLGMNYHWVSDCIAGLFLGTAVAVGATRLIGLDPTRPRQ